MDSENQLEWPKSAYTVGNAGVLVIGSSESHGGQPAVLLGGRWYTRKKAYMYTDFGGGVDKCRNETPQQGAFREFAEELLGQNEEDAELSASKLCSTTSSNLVGGRPFVHRNNYAMFIVPAENITRSLSLPVCDGVGSAIDQLFNVASRNKELTSVALVSVAELLRGASQNGRVCPLSVRGLDDQCRRTDEICLRHLMVGPGGSINTIRDVLESLGKQDPPHCQAGRAKPATSKSQIQRRWIKHTDNASVSAQNASKLILPAELDMYSQLLNQSVRVQWQEAEQDQMVDGILRQAQGLKSIRVITNEGDVVLIPASAVSSIVALEDTFAELPSGVGDSPDVKASLGPYVFDMETGDPDDVLTLLFLASHPGVELRAVTITPGSEVQVALVRWILQQLGMTHVRLGAQAWPANSGKRIGKSNLGDNFYQQFGRSLDGEPKCERADLVLLECCDHDVTLVTGAALHNLGDALKYEGFCLGRWVAQGGFAGEGVVPAEKQMDKFKDMETCSTWNFGGNISAARAALASDAIARKICVSKNVCHSVYYDAVFHGALREALQIQAKVAPMGKRWVAFKLMYDVMENYLRRKPDGKKLHDPLALATAFDESVCELAEVELFCHKGQWGSRLHPGSNTLISIGYDAVRFKSALLE